VTVTVNHSPERPIRIEEIRQGPFDIYLTGSGISNIGSMEVGSLTDDEMVSNYRVITQLVTGSFVPAALEEPTSFLSEFLARDWGVEEFWEERNEDEIMVMPPSYSFMVNFEVQSISYGMPSPVGIED
jgi:hypothetical protein